MTTPNLWDNRDWFWKDRNPFAPPYGAGLMDSFSQSLLDYNRGISNLLDNMKPEKPLRLSIMGLEAKAWIIDGGTVIVEIGCQTRTLDNWMVNVDQLIHHELLEGNPNEVEHARYSAAWRALTELIDAQFGDAIRREMAEDKAKRTDFLSGEMHKNSELP